MSSSSSSSQSVKYLDDRGGNGLQGCHTGHIVRSARLGVHAVPLGQGRPCAGCLGFR